MKTWTVTDSLDHQHDVEADYLQHEEDGFVAFLRWIDPDARNGAEYAASFCRPVSVVLREDHPEEAEVPAEGTRVKVTLQDKQLFYGYLASTRSPWAFWTRVTPDGDIDLPPIFKVEKA